MEATKLFEIFSCIHPPEPYSASNETIHDLIDTQEDFLVGKRCFFQLFKKNVVYLDRDSINIKIIDNYEFIIKWFEVNFKSILTEICTLEIAMHIICIF